MMARETDRIRWWVFAGLALGVALVASLSRASILSTAVALFLLVLLIDRTPNYWIVLIPTVGLVGSLAVAPFVPISRFQPSYVLQSVITRFEKWDPILSSLDVASVLGAGKGSLTVVSGVEEAHNFYLRVFVEAGILGLLALLTTLVLIVAAGYTISRKSRDPVVASIGVAAFCATLSVAVASLFQDALINVKLAESYWLLVGVLGAALRLATAHL
jgi:O-antigen ligase